MPGGFLHSSAMLTESSKPTMAKKASVVAAITGQTRLPVSETLNSVMRDTSPSPAPIAHRPMTMMIRRPLSSTQVSTTFAFTLSPTPRKLTAATRAMKASPMRVIPIPPARLRSKAFDRLAAKAREAVDAEVMPEHMTAKATINVTK
jgi:hypothetical protein